MNIQIRGKHIDIGESLTNHIQTQMESQIGKYYENIPDANVTMGKDANLFTCHIQVHVGKNFFAEANGQGDDAYKAFADALEHAAKQVRRHKRIDHDTHHRKDAQSR